ncbi:hypothetical protein F2P81_000170 [Scophthalmus maximus]|uniref:Uncharacterized protein n=1 Tax=Scophthalmus maximus TaxID=52904 RepID=A0A6A4TII1_SCOMX|nr:hypothetical protein F2P81_000170 [Scophthalmus maximus]
MGDQPNQYDGEKPVCREGESNEFHRRLRGGSSGSGSTVQSPAANWLLTEYSPKPLNKQPQLQAVCSCLKPTMFSFALLP